MKFDFKVQDNYHSVRNKTKDLFAIPKAVNKIHKFVQIIRKNFFESNASIFGFYITGIL